MRRTAAIVAVVLLLAAACRRESREPVRVITSTEVAGSGLPQRLTETFSSSSGVRTVLQVIDADSLRGRPFDREPLVVITNDRDLVARISPRARLAAPFARADFVVVGPNSDPARVKAAKTAPDAFRRIAASQRAF
ncbi:MAG: hypothetical protein WA208_05545, partial [Thermoanaerobaculia bacterium]